VYPADARSPSHAWCYVCQERWDVIALWQKFNGTEKFGQALIEIERTYHLETPEEPEGGYYGGGEEEEKKPEGGVSLEDFDTFHGVCERRLREAKPAFDMLSFLRLGSVLDRVGARVTTERVSPVEGVRILRQVLDKIGEKVRSCPGG